MIKDDIVSSLNTLESLVRRLLAALEKIKVIFVDNKDIQEQARIVSQKWFEDVELSLEFFKISEDTKNRYSQLFTQLLTLSTKLCRKSTYVKLLNEILQDCRKDILVPVLRSSGQILTTAHLTKILENATEGETRYLIEALGCASYGFFKASVVLAWSAAIDRIHRVVEKLGFDEFNRTAEETRKAGGRYKRFNRSFNVHSLIDLRATVFDNDLLWVLEFWQLIDANQHERLSNCFTMRNNSAHPGEAVISPENIGSFYSDLKNIVFDNPKFKL